MRRYYRFIYIALIVILIGGLIWWRISREEKDQSAVVENAAIESEEKVDSFAREQQPGDITPYLVQSVPPGETVAVRGNTAVFVSPSIEKINRFQEEMGEEDYSTVLDDIVYYDAEARTYLKAKNIKIVDTQKRYLSFIDSSGSALFIDTNKFTDNFFLLFFFRDGKDPRVVPSIDVENEYNNYFSATQEKNSGTIADKSHCETLDTQDAVKRARDIERNINTYAVASEDIADRSSEGGEQYTFTKGGSIVSIKQVFYGETGKSEISYYLKDNAIFYFVEKSTDYIVPLFEDSSGKIKNVDTGEFYLDSSQTLCLWHFNQRLRENDPDTIDRVQYLISNLNIKS
ncbi:MAG: hypothetical protein V4665_01810 [Patescibacteria group bacterium]